MQMPGRSYSSPAYRYGFNGQEMDHEPNGQGNQYYYGFRIYNPRLGRFLSVDPLASSYAWLTTYQFAENCSIQFVDIDGKESGWVDVGMGRQYMPSGDLGNIYRIPVNIEVKPKPQVQVVFKTPELIANDPAHQAMNAKAEEKMKWRAMMTSDDEAKKRLGMESMSLGEGGDKLSTAGKNTVGTGIALTALGQPEIGLPLITIGEGMDDAGTAMKVVDNVKSGNVQGVLVEAGGYGASKVVGGMIDDALPSTTIDMGMQVLNLETKFMLEISIDRAQDRLEWELAPTPSSESNKLPK
jgi:RHS repeat-associated protein